MQSSFHILTPCSSSSRALNTGNTPDTPTLYDLPAPSTSLGSPPALSKNRKRSIGTADKENGTREWDIPLEKKPRPRSAPRTTEDKRNTMWDALKHNNWTLGEFLFETFCVKDHNDEKVSRGLSHAQYVQHFLQGREQYTPAMILTAWYEDPAGHISVTSDDINATTMFSTDTPYTDIKPVRSAMSAFAAQLVKEELVKESKKAVEPTSGLHATSKKRGKQKLEWMDIGTATVGRVSQLIQEHQPLTWYYMKCIASRRGDPTALTMRRPVDTVCTHAISALNFAHSNEARLLPLARGLFYFASSAPADLFSYACRIGDMPAYSTIYRALKGLASYEAQVTLDHAMDPASVGFLQFDNVQNYLRQRDARIGRTNVMNVGLAGTYVELKHVQSSALDLDNKRRQLAENKRAALTVEQLIGMINTKHVETVFILHWLRILVNHIPQLSKSKEHISILFRERAKRLPLPAEPSRVYPLASSGKNETVTTELKDALVDFFSQLGQTPEKHPKQLLLVGGDGLTYEKILMLKKYLQFHTSPFQSLETVEPVLALWHTEWTDVNRIFETHWDSHLSIDPSSLGHSAAKIGQAAPKTLKKIDYYPGVELINTVLEARILDCWRIAFNCKDLFIHFDDLASKGSLPEFEDLEAMANSFTRHIQDPDLSDGSEWAKTVPSGTTWTPPISDTTSQSVGAASSTTKGKKGKKKDIPGIPKKPFMGDRVLANSIAFIRDALCSREMAFAIAEGDPGHAYEMMKVMLFTFAGSTHSKYTNYLLETVCNLELESSPELCDAILRTTLINLSGKAGGFSASDIIQEYFNHLLEAIVEWKGAEYGADFVHKVVSRNLHHFARIKLDLREGVGLGKRSSRHTAPHLKPELRKLLSVYAEYELHYHRPGRLLGSADRDVDDVSRGLQKLRSGKLKKWIFETTTTRGLLDGFVSQDGDDDSGDDMDPEEDNDDDHDNSDGRLTFGLMQVINGELVFDTEDTTASEIDEWMAMVDGQDDDDGPADELDMDRE